VFAMFADVVLIVLLVLIVLFCVVYGGRRLYIYLAGLGNIAKYGSSSTGIVTSGALV
jgi:hypothetical protein